MLCVRERLALERGLSDFLVEELLHVGQAGLHGAHAGGLGAGAAVHGPGGQRLAVRAGEGGGERRGEVAVAGGVAGGLRVKQAQQQGGGVLGGRAGDAGLVGHVGPQAHAVGEPELHELAGQIDVVGLLVDHERLVDLHVQHGVAAGVVGRAEEEAILEVAAGDGVLDGADVPGALIEVRRENNRIKIYEYF